MIRRKAIKAILSAAAAPFIQLAAPRHGADGDALAQAALLAGWLPRGRAHLIASDPSIIPHVILNPLIESLQADGSRIAFPRPGNLPGERHVLVLDGDELQSPRRLKLELPELDRWARRRGVTILVAWRMPDERHSRWIPPLAAACSWLIHVQDIVFDEPDHLVPTYYRTPVAVFDQGTPIESFSIRTMT